MLKLVLVCVALAFGGCKSDSQQLLTALDEKYSAAQDLHRIEREGISAFRSSFQSMESKRIVNKSDVLKVIETYFAPRQADLQATLATYDWVMKAHYGGTSNRQYDALKNELKKLSNAQLGRAANLLDMLFSSPSQRMIIFG